MTSKRGTRQLIKAALLILLVLSGSVWGCAFLRPPEKFSKSGLEEIKKQIHLKGPGPITAGAAKVEITPPVGTPLAGYSKRRGKPSVGIRDPLFVRVLVLSDGEDQLVLVSADLLLFPPPLADSILDKTSKELKIPRQAIVLAGTHTHSGTGSIAQGFLYEMVFGSYRPEVVEGIKGRVIWAIRQALEHQQPVRWGIGRRDNLLWGLVENRVDVVDGLDPGVAVLLVESMQGQPVAILTNAAAHPTLMDSKDFRFSADYPGELCRVVETAYPGVVCLFVNGTAGDLRPRDDIGSTPEERISRFGQALAEGVTGMVNQLSPKANGDLAAWGWRIPLPPTQLQLGPIPIHPGVGQLIRPGTSDLHLLALDHLIFVPLFAEMTTVLGQNLRLKLVAQGLEPILIGYADGYLGYAVTPSQWDRGTYEAHMTWYGPTFGFYLIEKIQELADLYSPKESKK